MLTRGNAVHSLALFKDRYLKINQHDAHLPLGSLRMRYVMLGAMPEVMMRRRAMTWCTSRSASKTLLDVLK